MIYRRVGRWLQLPLVLLGPRHTFADLRHLDTLREILRRAVERSVTHIELANH